MLRYGFIWLIVAMLLTGLGLDATIKGVNRDSLAASALRLRSESMCLASGWCALLH
jgi:hypothetical protein